ncbi:Mu transposase domain-containing protein [Streptomyces sp. MS191]|uniref:Mu transposase domain-containing protein n=1 Tax=Streptomyces sp. ms191 TaxID=1827978 RepID=UPI0021C6CDD2|nr:hypothetical protein [Streptomyces sp. ms191]
MLLIGNRLPLPDKPFVLACWSTRWSTATVGPDIHVKVGRTLYSVPWKLIGCRVDVRSTATMVQVFHEGQLVETYAALEQGKRTDKTSRTAAAAPATSKWSACSTSSTSSSSCDAHHASTRVTNPVQRPITKVGGRPCRSSPPGRMKCPTSAKSRRSRN